MIAYAMLGTNDADKAHAFYEKLFDGTGVKVLFTNPAGARYYGKPGQPMLGIGVPIDGGAANFGNGTMVALGCDSTEEVDAFHQRALDAGGTCDGKPGWRLPNIFYGAYFRDPDGNKLCACKLNMGG